MVQIRECAGRAEEEFFHARLNEYFVRDMFPDPEDEDREYFLGLDYRRTAEEMHSRENDRLRYLLFARGGETIGFVMAMIYESEDSRCFLMEFCVFPEFRGSGTGRACARAFEQWAYGEGAAYIELNAHTQQRQRFWHSVGYVDNGCDDWGDPSLMLPPARRVGYSARPLRRFDDWQLTKLVNGLRMQQGEPALEDAQKDAMVQALASHRYRAFIVQRGWRWVGIAFTDASGAAAGHYVEPVFCDAEAMLMRAVAQAVR